MTDHGPSHLDGVGVRELWTEMRNMNETITHISKKLDTHIAVSENQLVNDAGRFLDQSNDIKELTGRVWNLEQRPIYSPKAMWSGVGVIVGALSLIVAVVIAIINGVST